MRLLDTTERQTVSGAGFMDSASYAASTVSNLVVGASGALLGAGACIGIVAITGAEAIIPLPLLYSLLAASTIVGYNISRGIQEGYHALYYANNPAA